jgi:flagellar FliJ protein
MADLSGLLLAIELATKHRDACQGRLAVARRTVAQDLDQLHQLQAYAGDKDTRWIQAGTTVFSGELVKHHYQFMDRLQQAMAQQSGVIQSSEVAKDKVAAVLLEAEIRLAGLKEILRLRLRAKDVLQKRREQKQTDEFASQQYARKRSEYERGEHL